MSDSLSSDLESLKIQRKERPERTGALKALVVAAILLGAGTVAYVIGRPWLEARMFAATVEVTEIALVSPAQAQIELTSTGYVVPQTTSKVGAKVPGRIARVLVKEGDTVKTGSLLARLDDVDQRSAINTARSRVLAAQARAQTARANLAETEQQAQRERNLVARGVSPVAVAEDLEARARSLKESVKAADAEVRAAQAEVDAAGAGLQHTSIEAPIDGTVVVKPLEVGELVGPITGPILELADLSTLVVETDVAEGRLHKIKIGGPSEITLDAFPGRRLRGRTTEISPRVNRAKATVTVKVQFVDSTEGILPEMSARVSFLSAALDEASMRQPPRLVVPGSAVTEREGAKVVFVVEGDRVRMRPVTLGEPFGSGFVVTEGPAAGARVVKDPAPTLTDGQKVKEQ